MIKSLEALERLRNTLLAEGYWQDILQDVSIIEKELKESENYKAVYRLEHEKNQQLTSANLKLSKALEIIKYKQVSVRALEQCVKTNCSYPSLTEEEFNLLKEVLL